MNWPADLEKLSGLVERVRSRLRFATFIADKGIKLGKIGPPIRAALTGTTVSPPIFDILSILGRDEALARLRDQVA